MAKVSTVALSAQDELKKQAAHRACEYVKSGMVLGLGTGSTTAFAVDRIGELLKSGELKDIIGVPTSIKTYEQAAGMTMRIVCTCTCHVQEIGGDIQPPQRLSESCSQDEYAIYSVLP